ncbi:MULTISPECIES: lipid IV(A) 3-deoxy-D-manno-octulosonic acid transferase [Halomonadaceae]|uniref:lipid IV(A) 3-deoxy-D-manno-octulosonic acid transferase n=1 Tax=Halomonadaceae TaxID=28256 RepID=UPI001599B3B0|nr:MULTISPECIES: lipid IV(A) 3-deoxy-D-manno-octulosonic acid transferase [Halomonas]QJQ95573.1 3-deoxy-D-manno-octulosonic acid transferase [Halomonas sp. PA5]
MSAPRWPRWLYSAALYLLAPLIWKRVWREQAAHHPRRQRLGLGVERPEGAVIWLHCASVGEVLAARPLIEALLAHYPDHHLRVTTMTATGADRVAVLAASPAFNGRVSHSFLPLDFPGAARHFVCQLRPSLVLLFETELWPNLLHACHRQRIPVAVVNGRLSERAFRRYRHLKPLMRGALQHIGWLAAKSEADLERFEALGMARERSQAVGSLKFDQRVDTKEQEVSEHLRTCLGERPIWVAGSTHPGEDEQLLAAHGRLRESFPEALLILVPRHPQRFDAVAALCRERGVEVARRSRNAWPGTDSAIYLGDTMGELAGLYGAGDIAFVGGSLIPVGGHNLLEPAALGVPVISGPSMDNFLDVVEVMRDAGALIEVDDSEALADELRRLFGDAETRQRLGDAGRGVVEAKRGALERTMHGLRALYSR